MGTLLPYKIDQISHRTACKLDLLEDHASQPRRTQHGRTVPTGDGTFAAFLTYKGKERLAT